MTNIFKAGKYELQTNKKTLIMGILNVTPDSFSDGGLWNDADKAINRALEIQNLGADIIDIGAQSTRPGFKQISAKEEWNRLFPVLEEVCKRVKIPVSVDTFYPEVAEKSIKFGASIINDVTGFENKQMFEAISKSSCGIIIMNNKSSKNIKHFFTEKIKIASSYNIDRARICLDPGIGFLESRNADRFVINNLDKFKIENIPLLIGISRKRVVAEYCDTKDNYSRLPGTIAANTVAIIRGANILRVHDIREGILAAKTADAIIKTKEIFDE